MKATATAAVPASSTRANRAEKNQGMNWISQHKRLAIYLRDGLACVYCGNGVENGTKLTLDHLIPYSKGGAITDAMNLVTCCHRCNSTRGNRPRAHFVAALVETIGGDAESILRNIKNARCRKLNIKAAKELIARRGSCLNVLTSLKPGE